MSKKPNFKISQLIVNYLIEAILIFTSVFFAFWLTEVRETKKTTETLKKSLQHIGSEMEYNHKRIEYIYEYYTNILKQIDSLRNEPGVKLDETHGFELKNWMGVQIPMLQSTAYQTFLNSGATDAADFDMAKSFADIYNVQAVIEQLEKSFYDIAATDMDFTSLYKVKHTFGLYAEILPDLIFVYQTGGKKWLTEYGYNREIKNENIRKYVAQKIEIYENEDQK